jgi:hypothetical protein
MASPNGTHPTMASPKGTHPTMASPKGTHPTTQVSSNKKIKETFSGNMNSRKGMHQKEHFFPFQNQDVNNSQMPITKQNVTQESPMMNEKSCLQTYVPMYESVSDVCSPVATFKNELNAQGLNYPEGFNYPVLGSPLS